MYKNRNADGTFNLCGKNIKTLRKRMFPSLSQKKLADRLVSEGIELDKNAIQKIESGKRFVTDLELKAFASLFRTTADALLSDKV